MSKKVAVVGAGLSGLACAIELKKKGLEVEVFESGSSVGGRVQTEKFEGFLLDLGFQVYLPAYEMGQYYFDHKALKLKSFSAGAKIFKDGSFQALGDPLREPSSVLSTLSSQLGTFKDKMLILKLKVYASKNSEMKVENQSTLEFLKNFGFSQQFIKNFFTPFFTGVFLEDQLKSSSSYFLYLFDKFANCEASLPEGGMVKLAEQLGSEVGLESISFGSEVSRVTKNSVQIKNGELKNFDAVVLAVTPGVSNLLLGADFNIGFYETHTHYYKTKSHKFASKKLFLNANVKKVVNHVACLSAVNASYAPTGWSLFSVSTVGVGEHSQEVLLTDLKNLFGEEEINTWQHLKSYKIKCALPSKPLYSLSVLKKDSVYLCGDFTKSPSIQGALSSGYQVAQEISTVL